MRNVREENTLEIPSEVVQRFADSAQRSDTAIVHGNRAGIIKWANPAWLEVTGYALDRFIAKPVGDFLRTIDVESDVINFVGNCFRDGKTCEVDVPITTPTGESIWTHIRVEPLLDSSGEPSDFFAVATNVTEHKRAEIGAEITAVDLSTLALEGAIMNRQLLHEMTWYDLNLAEDVPCVLADVPLLKGLVARLIGRAADATRGGWGTISISTGLLGMGDAPLFEGNIWKGLPHGQFAYIEVHDTGSGPHSGIHQVAEEPFLSSRFPESSLRLSTVQLLLRNLGGEVRLQSAAWYGTSVVILLPYAIEHGLEGS